MSDFIYYYLGGGVSYVRKKRVPTQSIRRRLYTDLNQIEINLSQLVIDIQTSVLS